VHLVGVLGQGLRQRAAGDDAVIARVRLQPAHGGDQHRGIGGDTRHAALDVEEPLGAHVGAETGLGEQEVARPDADRSATIDELPGGDVAERPGVHERRRVLERLHQVGLDRSAQDHRHRSGHLRCRRR
jgi:hypothetical protein